MEYSSLQCVALCPTEKLLCKSFCDSTPKATPAHDPVPTTHDAAVLWLAHVRLLPSNLLSLGASPHPVSSLTTMTTPRSQHVLIIGGGLAGPCLALSLAQHSIRSTIFEICPTRSKAGGSISLGPNALRVLDQYAGVYDRIRAAGFSYYRLGAYAEDGEKLGDTVAGEEDKGAKGYPAVRVLRSTLHKVLLDAGQEMSGLIDIKWGAEMSRIEESEEGVTAYFVDGSKVQGERVLARPQTVMLLLNPFWQTPGDVMIVADGIHSKVRQHILGSQAPTPIFDGLCIVNGFLPASSAVTPNPDLTFPAFMFTRSGVFMTIPIDAEAKTLAWGINKHVKEHKRGEWRELERSGEVARLAKADYDNIHLQPLRSLLDNAEDKETKIWAPYSIPDLPTWHTPKVCLIGDAAHGLPPNGQGSTLAFQDAALLTRLLISRDTTSYDDMFSRFETIRRPHIERLRQSSKTFNVLKAKTGPWVWYLKKWAFRAFFWWNGGVVHHGKETDFDFDEVDLRA